MAAQKLYKKFTVTNVGGTININTLDVNSYYLIIGSSVTLTSNLTIAAYENGTEAIIYWMQDVNNNGNNITIFGTTFTRPISNAVIICTSDGNNWHVNILEGLANLIGNVTAAFLAADAVTTTAILDEAVTLNKLADLARGSIISGQTALNRPLALDGKTLGAVFVGDGTDVNSVVMSGDATIAASGDLTIANAAVTNAKMAKLARGSIKVGGVSNAVTDLVAKTNGTVVAGDGTDVKSLTVSKDVSATASGSNLEFSVLKGTSSTANSVKGGLIMAKTIYSAQVKPILDTGTHNLMPISLGDDVLEVRAFVQTAAGTAGVISVGFDAAANGGVADTDGLLLDADGAVAGVYSSIDPALTFQGAAMAFGEWTAAADGYLTITSGHDLTASAIVVNIVVIYRSK